MIKTIGKLLAGGVVGFALATWQGDANLEQAYQYALQLETYAGLQAANADALNEKYELQREIYLRDVQSLKESLQKAKDENSTIANDANTEIEKANAAAKAHETRLKELLEEAEGWGANELLPVKDPIESDLNIE